ncbi:hypothetical protein BO83DRAFT_356581 [Aspergillus eucalypticola CBS 122712]|uniref:NWD NACHT-NTPase N-terminal domain-containing protein n=1 Tax=Aspergillus eucalypticola (strain CBS 122712 / IBT 29274) TaxID=1448314 RepID=A0A317W0A0_ASPEC|nr:uncharacterized protein BO83DRAFT_356581 [Aspergillus eucalypticola CBS 122712]PWY79021.1 hypothetical protein BO83DRAFT_356581 [Aspergillus eucalypticola CBS 122712]
MPFRKRLKDLKATLRPPTSSSLNVSQDTSTASLGLHKTPVANASSSNTPDPVPLKLEGLWKKAYSDLRNKNPDLLVQYERILLFNTELDSLHHESRVEGHDIDPRLESCVKRRLEAIQKSRLKIYIRGREIEVRKQVRRVVGGIMSMKDIISAAVSAELHASIAWAGVLFLLDPLAKSFHQNEDALNGFQAVSDLMIRYAFLEKSQTRIYMQSGSRVTESAQHLAELVRSKTVELYVLILEYHICLATHFSRSGYKRFLKDWVDFNKWRNLLESITCLDGKIRQNLTLIAGDDIQKMFKELEKSQQIVMTTLSVLKENFKEAKQKELLDELPVVSKAKYGSFDDGNKSECLEGTRTEILREIQCWAESPDDSQVFWVRGMAGTGKSTISRTFAAACQERKSLIPHGPSLPVHLYFGASFFFDRSEPGRNTVEKLFPSVSNELASSFPDSRDKICQAISENQSIGTQNLRNQWHKLILEPLLTLEKELLLPVTLALMLDALDEAVSADPEEAGKPAHDIGGVLRLLATAGKLRTIRLKIFLTSRPEIYSLFSHFLSEEVSVRDFELRKTPMTSEAAKLPKDDITLYLEHHIKEIASHATIDIPKWRVKSTCWLSQDDERRIVRTLADRSDGLFIYAATACRFLDGVDDLEDLQARMRELSADDSGESPQEILDRTYSQILKYSVIHSCRKTKTEKADFFGLFKRIIGAVVVLAEPLSIAPLEDLLDLSGKTKKIRRFLTSLSSVVSFGDNFELPIRLLHLSFREFLLGQPQRRCLYDEFCIDPREAHKALFKSCVRILSSTLKQDICSLDDPSFLVKDIDTSLLDQNLPVSVRYASQYWAHHLQQAGFEPLDNDCVHEFLKKHFLYWIEVMSLLRIIPKATFNLIELERYLAMLPIEGRAGLQDMVFDMKRFMLASKNEIENAPLQVYRSALIFSPKHSICRKTFQCLIPRTFSRLPEMKDKWDPLLQELDNRESSNCLAMSSDGQTLAVLCGSWNCHRIRLWNLTTGTSLYTIDCGGNSDFIMFLPEDKHILSFSEGLEGVQVWDTGSGMLLRKILLTKDDATNGVCSVRPLNWSFSSQGCLAAVYPGRMTIGLISAAQGTQKMIHVSTAVNTIAWSADGATLAVPLNDGSIVFWDTSESKFILSLSQCSGIGKDFEMTFSANGELLTQTLLDDYVLIRLWEWKTKTLLVEIIDDSLEWRDCQSFGSHTIMHFSPSEKLITTWHLLTQLQRWDSETGQRLLTVRTPNPVWCIGKLSPNGKYYVVAWKQDSGKPITELLDSATGKLLTTLRSTTQHSGFVFNSDSRLLVSVNFKGIIQVWDLSSEIRPEEHAARLDPVCGLALSHDHQFALSASISQIRLWNIRTGSLLRVVKYTDTEGFAEILGQVMIRDYKGPILTNMKTAMEGTNTNGLFDDLVADLFQGHFHGDQVMEISSDGRLFARPWLLHCKDDFHIKVWDVITGNVVSAIPRGYNGTPSSAFSPDGRLLAIGHKDRDSRAITLEVWDVFDGRYRHQWNTGLDEELNDMKIIWSTDGTKVAINCFMNVCGRHNHPAGTFMCDLATDKAILLEKLGVRAAISPNGRLVVTIDSDERSLSLWESVEDNLTLLGQRTDMNLKWDMIGSEILEFQGDEVVVTSESRIDVRSFLSDWDLTTSRQIQVKDHSIIYGSERVFLPLHYRPRDVIVTKDNVFVMRNESGEVTFWEFADEKAEG